MKLLAVALVAACGGGDVLVARTAASVQIAADHPYRGSQVDVVGGLNGVELGAGLFEQQLVRAHDPNSHASGGAALFARLSLVDSLLRRPGLSGHVDAGFDAGAGTGFTGADGFDSVGQAWYGGWLDLGIGADDDHTFYALALGIREVVHAGAWTNGPVYTIGIVIAYHGDAR